MIRDHSDHGRSDEPMNQTLDKDLSVHLIYHDPSDLGSLILIRIIPKERTLRLSWIPSHGATMICLKQQHSRPFVIGFRQTNMAAISLFWNTNMANMAIFMISTVLSQV